MGDQSVEYRLRCELRGHDDDVRKILSCGNSGIATSSRDTTVRFWTLDAQDKNKYMLSKTLVGHSSFVGPLAWISPNEDFPEGGIVSGGMDALVLIWDLKSEQCVQTLQGHKYQVTGLVVDVDGDIISSSVDCTLRRWKRGISTEVWDAHKAAIQDVKKLPTGELVTASGDATVKLWRGSKCLQTFTGHTDTVRDLSIMSELGIISASHDGSIKLWALSGEVLMEMFGHTSIVYSVDANSSGIICSGSEDRFAKIWKDGICIQSIEHPGCVWDTKFLENGDLVTACSDGIARIWTLSKDRATECIEAEYWSLLSHYNSTRWLEGLLLRRHSVQSGIGNIFKKVGGLKLQNLPSLEALQEPGTHEGHTKVVREGDNGVAYSWNSREHKWDKIGEVVDKPGDSVDGAYFDGVRYDYDIGDGEPIRKLPYNLSENPYAVADKWLLKENLPLSYRQQVVEFILQNTGQDNFLLDASFRDPYTGSSAYVPGASSIRSDSTPKVTHKHVPKKGMLIFDAAQFHGILKKISEFNYKLVSDKDQNHIALKEVEMSRLSAVISILQDTSHYHSSTFADLDIKLLDNVLRNWPVGMIFPVIDILRMIVLHPHGAKLLHKYIGDQNDIFIEILRRILEAPIVAANLLTTIRVLSNLFSCSSFHEWLQVHCCEILDAFSTCWSSTNKNIALSCSTLILNYTILLIANKDHKAQAQVLSAAIAMAEDEKLDVDSKFRALVAIGTLMLDGLVKKEAIDFDVQSIAAAAIASKEVKIAEVGKDIELIIRPL